MEVRIPTHLPVTRSRSKALKTPTSVQKKRKLMMEPDNPKSTTKLKTPTSTTKRRKFVLYSSEKVNFGKVTPTASRTVALEQKAFVDHEISSVYKVIRKMTGTLGGGCAGGAIYGEITQKSFQRVVDFLKEHCEFDENSAFIDIGSGLGKPNFHVAVDPGVSVSFGMELILLRWQLSLHNLKNVMASETQKSKPNKVAFVPGDITVAKTFNPFTHVYSFDVGFPPNVMDTMAESFNKSNANYLISFHQPKKIIDMYGYDVENIGRVSTSMAGSSEGHTCYFYRRTEIIPYNEKHKTMIDPAFKEGIHLIHQGKEAMLSWVNNIVGNGADDSRSRRHARQAKAKRAPGQSAITSFVRPMPKLTKAKGG